MTLVWNLSRKLMQSIVAERWEEVLVLMGPSFLLALQINTETEERSNEEQFLQPLLYGLNAEGEKPESNCKDEGEGGCVELGGDAEKTTHPALGTERKLCSSMANVEPTSQQLLGGSTLGSCLPAFPHPTTPPGLDQPFSSSGYVPYYRTEAELCVGPAVCDRFLTRTEVLENEEGRWVEEKNAWNFGASCLVS
ncbi:uncharacterized protein LOC121106743 isoform X3 [Gallus gallus]|uniref:uncharacterized protein LOC121106743 isoform X3 n=1 Tax=Gallus gallus TaxID=9031 RepID=UPI001F0070FB|nr:uncharacterized protein LOC121106743 isoform X3 [Gallus gallus]